jgi:hypothetical protein
VTRPGLTAARRVDIAWFQRLYILAGGIVLTAFGASGLLAAFAALTVDRNSVAERSVAGVIGAVFLAIGVGFLIWRFRHPPRTVLEMDDDALRAVDGAAVRCELSWADIRSLDLVRTKGEFSYVGPGPGRTLWVHWPRSYLVVHLRSGVSRPPCLGHFGLPRFDLGVLPSTAHAVADALGSRLPDPQPRKLDRAGTERLRG